MKKTNKYIPFKRQNGTFGLKNASSSYKENKLKYIFSSMEESRAFARFLKEREAYTPAKRVGGGYKNEQGSQKTFLNLCKFKFSYAK